MREEVGLARGRKKVEQTGRRPSERERGLEKWEGRKRGKEQWIFLSLWCRGAFSPSEKPFFSSSFFPFLGASCTSSLSSLSLLVCPPRLSSVSMFCRPLLPSVYLSTSLTPLPRVFRWPLLSAFLLPLCSTCALPGCISSSPASPKRY